MPVFPEVDFTVLPRCYESEIIDRYLDEMGHMNVVWYTHMFSEGVKALFESMDAGLSMALEKGLGGAALESHVRYFNEAHLHDRVTIYGRFIARNEKRFQIMEFMWNETREELSASFEMVGGMFDLRNRKSTVMPEELCQKIDAKLAEHQALDWVAPVCGAMRP